MLDKYYNEPNESAALRSWVTWQMLRGAGFAMAFVVVLALAFAGLRGLGLLLPAESKEAPSPYGMIDILPMDLVA
jgi:Intrinsic membrane protein PufX